MRLSLALLAVSAVGMLVGAWLIAMWVVGLVLIVESIAVGAFALLRDDGMPVRKQQVPTLNTVDEVIRRHGAA